MKFPRKDPVLQMSRTHIVQGANLAKKILYNVKQDIIMTDNSPKYQNPAFIIDIDGVIMHSTTPVPRAREGLLKLEESKRPYLFLTNSCQDPAHRAKWMSEKLNLEIRADQILTPHSALKPILGTELKEKKLLYVGFGDREDAGRVGLVDFYTVDDLDEMFPNNDVMSKLKRKIDQQEKSDSFKNIEAIVICGSPNAWETNIQLMLDVILGNGHPNRKPEENSKFEQLPIYLASMDFGWMHAPVSTPRLGNGAFNFAFEQIYQKITGKKIVYTKLFGKPSSDTYAHALKHLETLYPETEITTFFGIGDNQYSDISGANGMKQFVPDFQSVLVKTGMYKSGEPLNLSDERIVNTGHRDLMHLSITPDLIVQDFKEAIDRIV